MAKMFVWEVELEETWSFHVKGDCLDENTYTVAAKSGEEAVEKAKKIALAGSWEDDEDDNKVEKCVKVSLIGLERTSELDG